MIGEEQPVKIIAESQIDYQVKAQDYKIRVGRLSDFFEADISWKLRARKTYSIAFFIFLLLQNIFVYGFVFYIYQKGQGNFKNLQPILSAIILGTIGETIGVIQIMVKWIFSDIDYSKHPLNNQRKK